VGTLSPEEIEKKRKEEVEARWDMIYMSIAVLTTLLVVALLMVNLPPFSSTIGGRAVVADFLFFSSVLHI
jgi:hypothetical protein